MVDPSTDPVQAPLHWSVWLVAGAVAAGLVVGFAAGLAKPHARR